MKVCVVSRGDLSLFPPTQGASVKLFYTLKTLSELGVRMYFVTAEDKFYYEVKKGNFVKKNYPSFLKESKINLIHKNILSSLGITPDIFVLYHPLVNFKLWFRLLYVTLKEKVDIIQAEFTAFGLPAVFVKLLTGKPVILVEHNVESFQLPLVTNLNSRGKLLVQSIEKFVCNNSDKVVVMNREEKGRLEKLRIKSRKIFIIPHGVDLKLYKKPNSKRIKEKYHLSFPTLVFHGVYSYKPNYDAVKTITEKILPELEKKGIKSKVLLIGAFPPNDMKCKNVIFTGAVKNLADYLDAADIAIVPLRAGGGMRMKILEYFAAKKPVISTRKGAEGIPAKNEKEIILAEMKDFPKHIIRVIKSKKLRERLSRNAFRFVQNYDWENICKKYVELYRNLL